MISTNVWIKIILEEIIRCIRNRIHSKKTVKDLKPFVNRNNVLMAMVLVDKQPVYPEFFLFPSPLPPFFSPVHRPSVTDQSFATKGYI